MHPRFEIRKWNISIHKIEYFNEYKRSIIIHKNLLTQTGNKNLKQTKYAKKIHN